MYEQNNTTRTRTEGHVVDGPGVAVDLLQRCVAAGVPDGDGPVFTAGHQQSPRRVQTDGVHLHAGVTEGVLQRGKKFLLQLCLTNMFIFHGNLV